MARRTCMSLLVAAALGAPAMGAERGDEDAGPLACGPRVLVQYTESVPDFFVVKNLSPQGWRLETLTIDLAGSGGDTIFDIAPGGAGVDGAADFSPAGSEGAVRLEAVTPVGDGGRKLGLRFSGFAAKAEFRFHIDLDDRTPRSPMGRAFLVEGEITGARVQARMQGPGGTGAPLEAVFDERGDADSGIGGCV